MSNAASANQKKIKYTKKTKEKTPNEENYKKQDTKYCKKKANYESHHAMKNCHINTSTNSGSNKSNTVEKQEQYCLTLAKKSYSKATSKPYEVQKNNPVNTSSNSNVNKKFSGEEQRHEQVESILTTAERYKQRGTKVSKTKANYKPYMKKNNVC